MTTFFTHNKYNTEIAVNMYAATTDQIQFSADITKKFSIRTSPVRNGVLCDFARMSNVSNF